jgi:nucleotide-binding universal stress UspA family protein
MAYTHDRHARVQEALLPFRRLCGGRAYANVSARTSARRIAFSQTYAFDLIFCCQVETVVVEGHDVAEALLRYAAESGVRSLVLGSVSFRWFQRCAIFPSLLSSFL